MAQIYSCFLIGQTFSDNILSRNKLCDIPPFSTCGIQDIDTGRKGYYTGVIGACYLENNLCLTGDGSDTGAVSFHVTEMQCAVFVTGFRFGGAGFVNGVRMVWVGKVRVGRGRVGDNDYTWVV
ncbi:hypothetical protein Barb6_02481 [Bacteroidales bacterium Barb6]|nr:hypothetical protein Barb6_02481 [Bacteroidales bacterium Barb6]